MNKSRALFIAFACVATQAAASYSVDIDGGRAMLFFNGIQTNFLRTATDLYNKVTNPLLLVDAIIQECIPLLHKEIEASLAKNNSAAPRAELVRDRLFTNHGLEKDMYSFEYNAAESGIIEITTIIRYENAKQLDPDYALESEKNQLKYIAARILGHTITDDNLVLHYTLKIPKKDFFDRYYAYEKEQQALSQPELPKPLKPTPDDLPVRAYSVVASTTTPATPTVATTSTLPSVTPSLEPSSKTDAQVATSTQEPAAPAATAKITKEPGLAA